MSSTNSTNGQTTIAPANGASLNMANGKAIPKDIPSTILYSDLAENFVTGSEPEFNSAGLRVVWTGDNRNSSAPVTYKLACLETSKTYMLWVSTYNSINLPGVPEIWLPCQLNAEVDKNLVIGIGVSSSKQALDNKHVDSYNDALTDMDAKVIGTSDKDGAISFKWIDVLYLLMNKRQGSGRNATDGIKVYSLDMDKATFDKLMSDANYAGKIKLHERQSRKADDKPDAK